ncbi:hypothetical protein BHE74_00017740 [Ensete ventricosum]|nr:hypothetical protein BHE74_00017740 [Ensete ventricosum]
MARPFAGVIGHGQAPLYGRSAMAKAPCKGVTCCGQDPLQGGQLDVAKASPQGQQPLTGTATCSTTPAKAAGCKAPARSCRQRPARKG